MPGSSAFFLPLPGAGAPGRAAANDPLPRDVRIFQLAAALDAYEARMTLLLENGFDSAAYGQAEQAVGEVRSQGAGLPELAVAALELCLAHAEVVALLWWERADGTAGASQLAAAQQRRQRACDALRTGCAQALKASGS